MDAYGEGNDDDAGEEEAEEDDAVSADAGDAMLANGSSSKK